MRSSRPIVLFSTVAFCLAAAGSAGAATSDGTCAAPESRGLLGGFLSDVTSIFHKAESEAKEEETEVKDTALNDGGHALGILEILSTKLGFKTNVAHPYQEKVSDTVWRGSRPGKSGIADLSKRGFKATVDLTAEGTGDASYVGLYGMHSLNVKIVDNTPPTEAQMITYLNFVTDPANQPVYVHCEQGIGRTGIAIAVYRMAVEGWTPQRALDEANAHGLQIPDQQAFILKFGADLAAGKIKGYPLTLSSTD